MAISDLPDDSQPLCPPTKSSSSTSPAPQAPSQPPPALPAGTGSYSSANSRARLALQSNDISYQSVLESLRLLPMPRNTQRLGVFPPGASFVLSANAGLTTTKKPGKNHGKLAPCTSSLVRKCPFLVELLAKFCPQTCYSGDAVVERGEDTEEHRKKLFCFTSITINKNYAAFPHRDANHFDGKARITALGDFSGGELWMEGGVINSDDSNGDVVAELNGVKGKYRDISNGKWCDFDARKLHGTMPFEGERFSLVYFSHEAFLRVHNDFSEESPRVVLENLGIRWPVGDFSAVILNSAGGENQKSSDQTSPNSTSFLVSPIINTNLSGFASLECRSLGALLKCRCEDWRPLTEEQKPVRVTIGKEVSAKSFASRGRGTVQVWKFVCESEGNEGGVESLPALLPEVVEKYVGAFVVLIKSSKNEQVATKRRNQLLSSVCEKLGVRRDVEDEGCIRRKLGILSENDGKISVWELIDMEEGSESSQCSSPRNSGKKVDEQSQSGSKVKEQSKIQSQTALSPALARVLCNLGKVTTDSLVLDPFAGEGSLLYAAKNLGAVSAIGTEIRDVAGVCAKDQNEHVRANIFHCPVRDGTVDAILTDPPFGRREPLFGEGNKNLYFEVNSTYEVAGGEKEKLIPSFSSSRPLSPLHNPTFKQLFQLSCRVLRPRGRLVFTYPCYPNSPAEEKLNVGDEEMVRFGNETLSEMNSENGGEWRWHLVGSADQEWLKSGGHCMRRKVIVLEKQKKFGGGEGRRR